MTQLEQFDVKNKTKPYRRDLMASLADMLHVGMQEFTKKLSTVFAASTGATQGNQITTPLSKWERRLQRRRK